MKKTASHPSGEKIAGDGTWGEGKSPFADTGLPAPPTDKRGPQSPSIQGFVGETGEIPASPVSMPDKRGGGAGAQGAAALGKAEADARGFGAEAGGGPNDPCARSPTKMPDGTQPGVSRKESPERPTVHERVCGKGEVHSSFRGRPAKEMVGGAVPYGTFAEQKLGVSASQAQGPAGASARGPEKSLGFGTAHIATGSCAPESPAMTVKMPPRHPALAVAAPRKRPQPSAPAFGARAPLPARTRADGETLAPRGLSVSQVHLSGPLSRPGPQVPRRDAPAEAPDHALAPDAAPATARQVVSPDGAFGGAKAGADGGVPIPFTPTAQQAAAQARGGGGGGGGLTPAQEYGANLNKRVEVRNEIAKSQAKQQKLERALELDANKKSWSKAEADEFYELAKEFKTGEPQHMEKMLEEEKAKQKELEQEDSKVAAANKKSAKNLSPTEQARAVKDAKRLKRDQDRQAEIAAKLEKARGDREKRNSQRPDYRATQRAKARRADNKRSKSLAKAKKLLKAAKNKNMSKSARKKAVEKAKKALQKAKEAGQAKIEAMKKAGDEEGAKAEEQKQAEENAALEQEIEEAEAGIDNGVRSEPQPDPCSLPCDCNIPCEDGICICFRWPAGGGDDGGDGGGEDGGDDGGGGGGAEPPAPEVKVPEGSSVAEPENGDDKKKDKEKKPAGNGKGGGDGPVKPPGGAEQFPKGGYFQQAGPDDGGGGNGADDDGGEGEDKEKKPDIKTYPKYPKKADEEKVPDPFYGDETDKFRIGANLNKVPSYPSSEKDVPGRFPALEPTAQDLKGNPGTTRKEFEHKTEALFRKVVLANFTVTADFTIGGKPAKDNVDITRALVVEYEAVKPGSSTKHTAAYFTERGLEAAAGRDTEWDDMHNFAFTLKDAKVPEKKDNETDNEKTKRLREQYARARAERMKKDGFPDAPGFVLNKHVVWKKRRYDLAKKREAEKKKKKK